MSRPAFSLFQSHLDLAKSYWERHLHPHSIAVDATCGNGHDSLSLARLCAEKGALYCLDIQKKAIDSTKALLESSLPDGVKHNIYFFNHSHETFPKEIPPCDLLVYNLGYLPGGDKSLTTKVAGTLKSFKNGLNLLKLNGLISITCYPGHPEGAKEQQALLYEVSQLSPLDYLVCHHSFENRLKAPSLLLIFKRK